MNTSHSEFVKSTSNAGLNDIQTQNSFDESIRVMAGGNFTEKRASGPRAEQLVGAITPANLLASAILPGSPTLIGATHALSTPTYTEEDLRELNEKRTIAKPLLIPGMAKSRYYKRLGATAFNPEVRGEKARSNLFSELLSPIGQMALYGGLGALGGRVLSRDPEASRIGALLGVGVGSLGQLAGGLAGFFRPQKSTRSLTEQSEFDDEAQILRHLVTPGAAIFDHMQRFRSTSKLDDDEDKDEE